MGIYDLLVLLFFMSINNMFESAKSINKFTQAVFFGCTVTELSKTIKVILGDSILSQVPPPPPNNGLSRVTGYALTRRIQIP